MSKQINGWWETVESHLKDYPTWLLEIGIYGFISCALGFLFKNFGRYIIFAFVGIIALAWLFSYLDLITINNLRMKDLVGLGNARTLDDGFYIISGWARAHIAACISLVGGFFLGWKLG